MPSKSVAAGFLLSWWQKFSLSLFSDEEGATSSLRPEEPASKEISAAIETISILERKIKF